MHKYEGKSIRKGTTHTGKIPSGVGFSGNVKGVTRKLTKRELAIQAKLTHKIKGIIG